MCYKLQVFMTLKIMDQQIPFTNFRMEMLIELLDPKMRAKSIEDLTQFGFINESTKAHWIDEFNKDKYSSRALSHTTSNLKLILDKLHESTGGQITSKKTNQIILRLIELSMLAESSEYFKYENIKDKSIVDYGAGTISTLSVAIVLFANGFSSVVACEPLSIEIDYALAGVKQTIQSIHLEPEIMNFSGISNNELITRVSLLNFENLEIEMKKLNAELTEVVNLGGIKLTKNIHALDPNSIDCIFSNSVLEHITNINFELANHFRVLRSNGLSIHTVDFSDHRAIGTNISPCQFYYDGILHHVNGLRPSEMESLFSLSGFRGKTFKRMSIPIQYLNRNAGMLDKYSKYHDDDLLAWVNSYILTKQ